MQSVATGTRSGTYSPVASHDKMLSAAGSMIGSADSTLLAQVRSMQLVSTTLKPASKRAVAYAKVVAGADKVLNKPKKKRRKKKAA